MGDIGLPIEVDIDNEKFEYRTIGISNLCLKKNNMVIHELMFYDMDKKEIDSYELELILSQFDNDCLLFASTKGWHFVSLTPNITGNPLEKARFLSEKLNQDYMRNLNFPYLTLRIAPKRENRVNGKIHKIAPVFFKILKKPIKKSILSYEHFKCYSNLGLDKKTIQIYLKNCVLKYYKIRIDYYYTHQ